MTTTIPTWDILFEREIKDYINEIQWVKKNKDCTKEGEYWTFLAESYFSRWDRMLKFPKRYRSRFHRVCCAHKFYWKYPLSWWTGWIKNFRLEGFIYDLDTEKI